MQNPDLSGHALPIRFNPTAAGWANALTKLGWVMASLQSDPGEYRMTYTREGDTVEMILRYESREKIQ